MVMSVIALVSALVIMFLTLSTRDRKTSESYRSGSDAKALSDMAVNLAMGQIRQATVSPLDPSQAVHWASQPGAIRTWQTDGNADKLFKLYSSSESIVDLSSPGNPPPWMNREEAVLSTWKSGDPVSSARFADMNEPISIQGGTDLIFPIADPRAKSQDGVEGFEVKAGAADGTVTTSGLSARLPMPVEWFYILADGTVGTLGTDLRFVPSQPGESPASSDNPIVGRIAYWTDDESSKVNLNTASEGIPWDTPRCVSKQDLKYATSQPVKNEVYRWPGHPATVCLSSIFFPNQILTPEGDLEKLKAIYDLAPRVHYENHSNQLAGVFGPGTGGIKFDSDRLYASIDEALFKMDRTENTLFTEAGIGREPLDRARFFLTVHSRAPELTVTGYPRISLWPVNALHTQQSMRVTPYDRALHFTTTLGGTDGREYGVQRQNPKSQVDEYTLTSPLQRNSQLAGYLEYLLHKNLPKYGLSLFDKYPNTDSWFNVYRCLDFIRSTNLHDSTFLTQSRRVTPYQENKIPGIASGCAFSEIVGKTGVPAWVSQIQNYRIPGRDYTISEVALVFICVAHHRTDGTKTGPPEFFSSIGTSLQPGEKAIQAALLFEGFCPDQGYVMVLPHLRLNLASQTLLNLRVNGKKLEHNGHSHAHTNLFEAWGEPPFSYGNTTPKGANRGNGTRRPDNWVGWGGSGGFHIFTSPIAARDNVENAKLVSSRTGYFTKEFFRVRETDPLRITASKDANGPETNALELDLTVERTWVIAWDARQRLRFRFPLPLVTPSPEIDPAQSDFWTWDNRMKNRAHKVLTEFYQSARPYDQILLPADVVRSVVVAHGDYRLPDMWGRQSGRFNDPSISNTEDYFSPHPGYHDSSKRQAHSLVPSGGDAAYYANCEISKRSLVPGSNYDPRITPDLPISPSTPLVGGKDEYAKGVHPTFLQTYGRDMIDPAITRDWNNGSGIAPDGAYTGKTDDGNQIRGGAGLPPYEGNLPPYFNKRWDDIAENLKSSNESAAPNRLINSAGIFGSFPSMPTSNVPWTTWLFRPDLSGGHIGALWNSYSQRNSLGNAYSTRPFGPLPPPDHMMLDLFWMPAIAPYGISDRFSTAGKININYQILPFTWIERKTALHAALKSEEFLAIPSGSGATYKNPSQIPNAPEWRHRIDAAKTLSQLDEVFRRGDAFASASEICEYFLIPKNRPDIPGNRGPEIQTAMRDFWSRHNLTGDNSLERPYANLYAKLTARSNVFRVHTRAQVIRKARSTEPGTFDPSQDLVTGEYRAETVFERYLPPNAPSAAPGATYPDIVTTPTAPPIDVFHRFRIIDHRRFSL